MTEGTAERAGETAIEWISFALGFSCGFLAVGFAIGLGLVLYAIAQDRRDDAARAQAIHDGALTSGLGARSTSFASNPRRRA